MLYKYFTACAYALLTYFFNRAYWRVTKKASNYYQDDIISQSIPKVVLL